MSRSSTITRPARLDPATAPVHPGEILREEFMAPFELTPYALAKRLRVPRTRIERLVREETAMTPDTALRLARCFATTPEFWLALQARHDIDLVRQANGSSFASIAPLVATS